MTRPIPSTGVGNSVSCAARAVTLTLEVLMMKAPYVLKFTGIIRSDMGIRVNPLTVNVYS